MIAADGVIASALVEERSMSRAAARLGLTEAALRTLLRDAGTSAPRLRAAATRLAYDRANGDLAAVAAALGCSETTVRRRLGLPAKPTSRDARRLAVNKLNETVHVYEETGSLTRTGERLGITREAVRLRLRQAGIDTRPPSKRTTAADIARARDAYRQQGTVRGAARALGIPQARLRRLLDAGGVHVDRLGAYRRDAHARRLAEAARLYADLGTEARVAAALGIGQTRVSELLRRAGVAPGRGRPRIPLDRIKEAVADTGSTTQAAALLGISPETIRRRLRQAGMPLPRGRGRGYDDVVRDTAAAYAELGNVAAVARRLGCSEGGVRRRLYRAGVTLKSPVGRRVEDGGGIQPRRSPTLREYAAQGMWPSAPQVAAEYQKHGSVVATAGALGRSVGWTRARLRETNTDVRHGGRAPAAAIAAARHAYELEGSVTAAARRLCIPPKRVRRYLDLAGVTVTAPRPSQESQTAAAVVYAQTGSVRETAVRLGVGQARARRILHVAGVRVPSTTRRQLTADDHERLVAAWQDERTVAGTARRLGVAYAVAHRWLSESGLYQPRRRPSPTELAAAYRELGTVRAVGQRFGYGEGSTSNMLRQAGIHVHRSVRVAAALEATRAAWEELGTVRAVAERLDASPQVVRDRLHALGIAPANRRLSRSELERTVDAYQDTGSVAEAARMLGLSANTVKFRLAQAGVTPVPGERRRPPSQDRVEAAATAYRELGSVSGAARRLGIATETLTRRLAAAGITPRDDRRRRRAEADGALLERVQRAYEDQPTIRHVAEAVSISHQRASTLLSRLGIDSTGDRRAREQADRDQTVAAYHRLGRVDLVCAELGLGEATCRRRLAVAGLRLADSPAPPL